MHISIMPKMLHLEALIEILSKAMEIKLMHLKESLKNIKMPM